MSRRSVIFWAAWLAARPLSGSAAAGTEAPELSPLWGDEAVYTALSAAAQHRFEQELAEARQDRAVRDWAAVASGKELWAVFFQAAKSGYEARPAGAVSAAVGRPAGGLPTFEEVELELALGEGTFVAGSRKVREKSHPWRSPLGNAGSDAGAGRFLLRADRGSFAWRHAPLTRREVAVGCFQGRVRAHLREEADAPPCLAVAAERLLILLTREHGVETLLLFTRRPPETEVDLRARLAFCRELESGGLADSLAAMQGRGFVLERVRNLAERRGARWRFAFGAQPEVYLERRLRLPEAKRAALEAVVASGWDLPVEVRRSEAPWPPGAGQDWGELDEPVISCFALRATSRGPLVGEVTGGAGEIRLYREVRGWTPQAQLECRQASLALAPATAGAGVSAEGDRLQVRHLVARGGVRARGTSARGPFVASAELLTYDGDLDTVELLSRDPAGARGAPAASAPACFADPGTAVSSERILASLDQPGQALLLEGSRREITVRPDHFRGETTLQEKPEKPADETDEGKKPSPPREITVTAQAKGRDQVVESWKTFTRMVKGQRVTERVRMVEITIEGPAEIVEKPGGGWLRADHLRVVREDKFGKVVYLRAAGNVRGERPAWGSEPARRVQCSLLTYQVELDGAGREVARRLWVGEGDNRRALLAEGTREIRANEIEYDETGGAQGELLAARARARGSIQAPALVRDGESHYAAPLLTGDLVAGIIRAPQGDFRAHVAPPPEKRPLKEPPTKTEKRAEGQDQAGTSRLLIPAFSIREPLELSARKSAELDRGRGHLRLVGEVTARQGDGELRCAELDLFLARPDKGGAALLPSKTVTPRRRLQVFWPERQTLTKLLAAGDVQYRQAGRKLSGDHLTYDAPAQKAVVTMNDPAAPVVLESREKDGTVWRLAYLGGVTLIREGEVTNVEPAGARYLQFRLPEKKGKMNR